MIHIPNESVYKKLCAENGTLIFSPVSNNAIAIIFKAPLVYLNEIYCGCEVEFVFGIHQDGNQKTHLCSALKLNDDPDHPITFMGIDNERAFQLALTQFFDEKKAHFFLFDEMNMNIAGCKITISEKDSTQIQKFFTNFPVFATKASKEEREHILDCLTCSIDKNSEIKTAHEIPTITCKISLSDWVRNQCTFFSENSLKSFSVNDSDQGSLLEARTWFALAAMFPLSLHRGAYYLKGNHKKEVTDILAFCNHGNFLIETKALNSTGDFYKKTMKRKIACVKKDILKAIKQLKGAIKTIKYNDIFKSTREKLVFGRSFDPHCIILVSEIDPIGSWDDIVDELFKATTETGAHFNLFDYKNFMRLLYGCRNNPIIFINNLINLDIEFIKNKNILIDSCN